MNTVLLVVIICIAVLLLATAIAVLFLTRFPEKSQPLAQFLMRFGPVRRRVEEQAVEEISNDPNQLIEAARQYGGRDMARALEQQLSGKSEAETRAMLDQAMKMAESGQMPSNANELLGKKPGQSATSASKRNKARAKRKAAKKQKRRKS